MITSLAWVPKGAARARPVRFELSNEEYTRIKSLADEEEKVEQENEKEHVQSGKTFAEDGNDIEDAERDAMKAEENNFDDLPAELRMDEYDDEESLNGGEGDELEDEEIAVMEEGELAFAMDKDDFDEEEEEDNEDDEIRPTDSLLVVAITEDEFSHLEVQLLSEDGNLYVHHDITLPEMPLCLAWMDCPPYQSATGGQGAVGNYMAVGTFAPAIEIWNLDVLDPLEPSATLGGYDEKAMSRNKKNKIKEKFLPGSHEAAVMSLSWNTTFRNVLASGSADNTVKLWDITTQNCSHTFTHHTKEVQSVVWHPTEAWLLATGSFDHTLSLIDCRSNGVSSVPVFSADTESLQWDPHSAYHLYAALENGEVMCIDVRNPSAPLFTFQANSAEKKKDRDNQAVSALSFSSRIPGMLATAGTDKMVKVWDVSDLSNENTPKCVAYKSMNVGKLLAMQFNADEPFMLATGGDKGMVAIWESDEQEYIKNHFESRVLAKNGTSETYSALTAARDTSNNSSSSDVIKGSDVVKSSDMGELTSQINTPKAVEDDSWMDDNTGVAGAAAGAGAVSGDKKAKKKKSKKADK